MPEIKIIDNPGLKGLWRHSAEWGFTTLMWALWVYLFLPLINLILWIAGGQVVYTALLDPAGIDQLIFMVSQIGWFVLAVFALLRGWGLYNYHAFGKNERRNAAPPATAEALAAATGLPVGEIRALQASRHVVWDRDWDQVAGRDRDGDTPAV